MKNIYSILFRIVFPILFFYSCQNTGNLEEFCEAKPKNVLTKTLTLDDAINEVTNVLNAITPTRSMNGLKVSQCYTITRNMDNKPKLTSLENENNQNEDAFIYIINFEDEAGYAIVAADPAAPSTILALTDSGSLNPNQPQDNPGLIMYLANMENILNVIPPIHASYGPWCYQSMGGVMCTNEWGQRNPYNLYSPLVDGKLPPAGCTATALAQLLTIYNYPLTYNGYTFNWDEMEKHMQVHLGNPREDYPPAYEMIGRLFQQISLPYNLNMQFGLSIGSGAYLYNVPRTMANLGFSDPGVYRDYYDTEEVKQALLDFYPVLVTGYAYMSSSKAAGQDEYLGINVDKSSINYSSGHTWLVDQLIRMHRKVTIINPDGTDGMSFTQERELVHCNFGWNGTSNGLYYSGAFDTVNGCVEPLNNTDGTAGNYQYYMQTYYGAIE